jgi:uncharacterized membrane protein
VAAPEEPNRLAFVIGLVLLVVAILLFVLTSAMTIRVIGILMVVVAAYLILRAFGWTFTGRR